MKPNMDWVSIQIASSKYPHTAVYSADQKPIWPGYYLTKPHMTWVISIWDGEMWVNPMFNTFYAVQERPWKGWKRPEDCRA